MHLVVADLLAKWWHFNAWNLSLQSSFIWTDKNDQHLEVQPTVILNEHCSPCRSRRRARAAGIPLDRLSVAVSRHSQRGQPCDGKGTLDPSTNAAHYWVKCSFLGIPVWRCNFVQILRVVKYWALAHCMGCYLYDDCDHSPKHLLSGWRIWEDDKKRIIVQYINW